MSIHVRDDFQVSKLKIWNCGDDLMMRSDRSAHLRIFSLVQEPEPKRTLRYGSDLCGACLAMSHVAMSLRLASLSPHRYYTDCTAVVIWPVSDVLRHTCQSAYDRHGRECMLAMPSFVICCRYRQCRSGVLHRNCSGFHCTRPRALHGIEDSRSPLFLPTLKCPPHVLASLVVPVLVMFCIESTVGGRRSLQKF